MAGSWAHLGVGEEGARPEAGQVSRARSQRVLLYASKLGACALFHGPLGTPEV